MTAFLAKRLAGGLVTLLVASVVVFAVLEILPGDPAQLMLGMNATDATLNALREQMGHVPREIAKNLGAQKLAQMIPIAGAAVGAGVNYWFTDQTAQAAVMLSRALYLERKERL